MKTIHHLKARWLLAVMLTAVVAGEFVAYQITQALHWRFPAIAIAAVCVGAVAAGVAWLYDGRE